MSSFAVTVEQLEILPHPNADSLELAKVGEYRAVVGKGQFRTGDYAIYIPEQAVLPEYLITELGLEGRLAGKQHNRVKAVRLRGELSQGIVCAIDTPRVMSTPPVGVREAFEGKVDLSGMFGITKWVPEIPANMAGEVEPSPDLIRWVDVENIKRYPDMFNDGEPVTATEKIHGTCCVITLDLAHDKLYVSSKGYSEKGLSIKESPNNLYWRAIRHYDIEKKLRELGTPYTIGPSKLIGLFGEVYGVGVQDLTYGMLSRSIPGFAAFDLAYIGEGGERLWISQSAFRGLMEIVDIPVVPLVYEGPYDYDVLTRLAEGPSLVGGSNIREGVVVRPAYERTTPVTGDRLIAKFVGEGYLTRKGETTEFE